MRFKRVVCNPRPGNRIHTCSVPLGLQIEQEQESTDIGRPDLPTRKEKILSYLGWDRQQIPDEPPNVRVHDSPNNDTPDSNSIQRQRAFIQQNFLHAGGLPDLGMETPSGLTVPASIVRGIPGRGMCFNLDWLALSLRV